MPAPLDDLIGREAELAALIDALRSRTPRLLVLTGPGGVGKSRLALAAASEVAATFADGVVFVSLAPIRDPALLATAIAQAAGIRALGEVPIADRLIQVFAERDLLLLLDNFEHVLAAANLVGGLLAACPRLTALVTSRARLRLTGEHDVPVPPLALPPQPPAGGSGPARTGGRAGERDGLVAVELAGESAAVQLFTARARAVAPAWQLTSVNAAPVEEICRRLDGLPLAIELAAAQSRLLAPAALLARLDHRLPLLVDGPRDQPARLQTMRQAIAWSYDLLAPAEQVVFNRLSVFLGGFGLAAAERVAEASLSQIGVLADQSLIQPLVGQDEPRGMMLETIREFGFEQLAASGWEQEVRSRHAAWYRDLAARLEPALYDEGGLVAAVRLLESERANVRSAVSWLLANDEPEAALRLVTQLVRFWYFRGYLSEGIDLLEQTLAAAPDAPAGQRAWAFLSLAMLTMSSQAFPRAASAIAAALPLVGEEKNTRGLAFARLCQAHFAFMHAELASAARLAKESERIAAQIRLSWDAQIAMFIRTKAELYAGDVDRAAETNRQLFASDPTDYFMIACARHDRGAILARRGDHRAALAAYADALVDLYPMGEMWNTPMTLDGAAASAMAVGEPTRAAQLFGQAHVLRTRSGTDVIPPERPAYDKALAATRAALGEAAFAAAWSSGMTASLAEIIDVTVQLAAVTGTSKAVATTGPQRTAAGLTQRESEVLALLVDGRNDPQIGLILSISPRTVESHVRHILHKLGVDSRTAAVAHAVRHGLV